MVRSARTIRVAAASEGSIDFKSTPDHGLPPHNMSDGSGGSAAGAGVGAGAGAGPSAVATRGGAGDMEAGRGGVVNYRAFLTFVADAVRFRRKKLAVNADDEGRIPWSTKIPYALPQFSITSLTMLIGIHGTIFFTKIGADVAFLAFFTAVARSFDVVTDPLMGYMSDKTRTKWGRRRPYMAIGCLFYSLMFILLFNPPAFESGTSVAIWFGIFYLIFYLFDTISNVPYGALGPELSDVSTERDSLFFWQKLVGGIGVLLGAVGPVVLMLSLRSSTSECQVCDTTCPAGPGAAAALGAPWMATEWGTYPDSFYNSTSCSQSRMPSLPPDLHTWCTCYNDCDSSCDVAVSRSALGLVAFGFGIYYFLAMGLCVWQVKERKFKSLANEEAPPLVPALLATLRNKPFMGLLPAWVCDMTMYTMIGTMLPFYIEYVIVPSSVPECEDGKRATLGLDPVAPENESENWCKTETWLGFGLVMLIGAQIAAMPIWLRLTKCFGKFKTWLAFNACTAVTNGLFVIIGRGDPKLCMMLAVINGMPSGAQFLTDSVVADVIDYDEFLTGQRSEGRFTIFQTFLPKIVSVPAQVIPLSLLSFFGFIPPVKGVAQEQPQGVQFFIMFVFFILPCALAITSFLIKIRFPINSKAISDQITRGAAFHLKGQAALDPLTNKYVTLFQFDKKTEQKFVYKMDYFFLSQLETMLKLGPVPGAKVVAGQLRRTLTLCMSLSFCSLVLTIVGVTTGLLNSDKWSWVPAFAVIGFGMSTSFVLFHYTRYKTALELCNEDAALPIGLLTRWVAHLRGAEAAPPQSMAAVERRHKLTASTHSVTNDDMVAEIADPTGMASIRHRKPGGATGKAVPAAGGTGVRGGDVELTASGTPLPHQVAPASSVGPGSGH